MEEPEETAPDAVPAEAGGKRKPRKKVGDGAKRNRGSASSKKKASAEEGEALGTLTGERNDGGPTTAMFDYSVENYLRSIDVISSMCGAADEGSFRAAEIERFSSVITFLTEWKHYYYKPKIIRFAYETGSSDVKDVVNGINLPQFSAVTVPKVERIADNNIRFVNSSKDFVLHVGGPVWGLDWCPVTHQSSNYHIKCEYLAVAAHPPDSSYHNIGAPLTGRGIIQIWYVLNIGNKEESPLPKRKGRPRKGSVRKETTDDLNSTEAPTANNFDGAPNVDVVVDVISRSPTESGLVGASHENTVLGGSDRDDGAETSAGLKQKRRMKDKARASSMIEVNKNSVSEGSLEATRIDHALPKDVSLPGVVLCLAHNGKVAWDVKWQPSSDRDPGYQHQMGFLAVLLGDGSMEVWEVPSPNMVKVLYRSCYRKGTDPRFVKLEPVFKCSKLKCGDRQCIPLTVEWSPSPPHDLILAGCHDGTVALWKFSARTCPQDTRPSLCFTADTLPIRSLAWSPNERETEGGNLIATAGHGGLKFWDLRDPFRPLWELNPARRVILSVDWLQDPRCVIVSLDDGTLRILSLSKAAYDAPVTGKHFVGTQQQGLQSYYCSSFTIWSVQVSRITGLVAYCSADGSTLQFQLTSKAVEKDPSRHRTPHFLCGSLSEEDSSITINTPLPNTPYPMKKSLNEWSDTPRSIRGFLSDLNQAKRANLQATALSFGDDPSMISGLGDSPAVPKGKKTRTPKTSDKKKQETSFQALSLGDEQENSQYGEDRGRESRPEEVFPPKIVAMHKVRWNMNKGSERWLCYGGAAGIIRCQEISTSFLKN